MKSDLPERTFSFGANVQEGQSSRGEADWLELPCLYKIKLIFLHILH